MYNHFQLSDQEFEQQFQDASLNPRFFSHEAHLRLAWIHVKKYGVHQAAENLCDQIKQFDHKFGDGTKYNKTVTVASAKALHHFIQRSKTNDFKAFINDFPRLKHNFKDILGAHYGWDIFNDEEAKENYLTPDLLPFS